MSHQYSWDTWPWPSASPLHPRCQRVHGGAPTVAITTDGAAGNETRCSTQHAARSTGDPSYQNLQEPCTRPQTHPQGAPHVAICMMHTCMRTSGTGGASQCRLHAPVARRSGTAQPPGPTRGPPGHRTCVPAQHAAAPGPALPWPPPHPPPPRSTQQMRGRPPHVHMHSALRASPARRLRAIQYRRCANLGRLRTRRQLRHPPRGLLRLLASAETVFALPPGCDVV